MWDLGLPFTDHLAKNFDEKEKKYADDYSNLLKKYSKSYCYTDLEVSKDLNPPSDLFVEVLATEDIGKIKTKYGGVNIRLNKEVKMEKNMTYHLRRSDIDHLLRKGLVTIHE